MLVKKLVIAEDDDAIAHLVSASLGDAGFLCLRASDGEQALNLTRTELPDALILDIMMPKLDGIEVCKRIKRDVLLSRIPILMLTSLADVDDCVAGLEAGADDYLAKPFEMRELAARIKAMIRQSRRERERNPTTNLPGREAVEDYVTERMRTGEPFTFIYVDLDNFRAYADVYGYRRADEVIALTGTLLLQACRDVGEEAPPFLAHVGGDDFFVICQPSQSESLIKLFEEEFAEAVVDYYDDAHRQQGTITVKRPNGEEFQAQFMKPSVAVIDVDRKQFTSIETLAAEIINVKSAARKHKGTSKQ